MNVLELFVKGGLVMYPLLICSLITVAIGVERVLHYKKMNSDIKEILGLLEVRSNNDIKAQELAQQNGAAARLIQSAVAVRGDYVQTASIINSEAKVIVADLRNYTNYLDVIVTLSPLLGLLGTVTGMISSFGVLNTAKGQPFAITGGVAEALVATATGLLVAIIALVVHSYLAQREDAIISEMEIVSNAYLKSLAGDGYGV